MSGADNINGQNSNENGNNDGEVYESIRIGQFERVVRGPVDYVERRMNETLVQVLPLVPSQIFIDAAKPQQLALPGVEIEDAPPSANGSASGNNGIHNNGQSTPHDLRSLYHEKTPKNQGDLVCLVTYYFQCVLGLDGLSLDDYEKAFDELRRVPASYLPTNLRSALQNAIVRSKYLFRPTAAKYALTDLGIKYVENMGREN